MSSVNETAYPRLNTEISEKELIAQFTRTANEIQIIFSQYRQVATQAILLIQLKLLQRLGNFIAVTEIPQVIIEHICQRLKTRTPLKRALVKYELSGSKWIHQNFLRNYVNIRELAQSDQDWLFDVAIQTAHTKQEIADIINVLIEELAHHRFELPSLSFLSGIATKARKEYNDQIYEKVIGAMTEDQRIRIDDLLIRRGGRTRWDLLKREPKRPGVKEAASYLQHIQELTQLHENLPDTSFLSVPKKLSW
jgi:hypothetical protein